MPKKTKKYKYLTKAEEKLSKYKRGLTASSLAAESVPVISDLLTGLFDKGGQAKLIRELAPAKPKSGKRAKPITEPYRPKKGDKIRFDKGGQAKKPKFPNPFPKLKFKRNGIMLTPVYPKGYKPKVYKMPKLPLPKLTPEQKMMHKRMQELRKKQSLEADPSGRLQLLNKGGSVTVATKLGRTKKTKIY